MQLHFRGELAFVTATLTHGGTTVTVPDTLIDTGAASSVFNADIVANAGFSPATRIAYASCEALADESTYLSIELIDSRSENVD